MRNPFIIHDFHTTNKSGRKDIYSSHCYNYTLYNIFFMYSVYWLYVWCQLFLFQLSDAEQLFTFEFKTIECELGMDKCFETTIYQRK